MRRITLSAIKKHIKVPIHLHTHSTSGVGDMTYLKAIEQVWICGL